MTEVVYRLYDSVDELSSVIENARSVPMSGGTCMVSRDILLDLLDDLRENLPAEVHKAGAHPGDVGGTLERMLRSVEKARSSLRET